MECSRSSVPERSFARFLLRSLSALRRDLPWIHARLCARLAPRELRLEVDGEGIGLRCGEDEIRRVEPPCAPAAFARTDRATILDLVDARLSLLDALLEERLVVQGAIGDVIAFHDGLLIYLHGAVRDPSFPALLRELRRGAEGGADGGAPRRGRGE